MAEMREKIAAQLREFWDAGIRGPDFVWAATGPAMEAYSKHPAVKKANSPTNEFLSVKEFLDAVRRIVIEFVVGRVLHIESGIDRLDPVTSTTCSIEMILVLKKPQPARAFFMR